MDTFQHAELLFDEVRTWVRAIYSVVVPSARPEVTFCHCQKQEVKCETKPHIPEHRVHWCLGIHSALLLLSLHSLRINFCRHWKHRNGPVITGLPCKTCLCRGHWAARALSPFWECLPVQNKVRLCSCWDFSWTGYSNKKVILILSVFWMKCPSYHH